MSIGRNEPCPCGSGKKYKKCCINKPKFYQWELNMRELLSDIPYGDVIGNTMITTLYELEREPWWVVACHSTSAILFVLLRDQGISNVERCTGEVKHPTLVGGKTVYFDHSWITIDGRIYDLAILKPNDHRLVWNPVVAGYDVQTKEETALKYGTYSGQLTDNFAQMVRSMTLVNYMDEFPGHKGGLWHYVMTIGSKLGLDLSASRQKYD